MIDGVKIDLPSTIAIEWLANDLLDFYTYTNTTTGELKDGTRVAKYKGLTFIITASIKYNDLYYCKIRGSLHKYYNNGHSNSNDFTIIQLLEVINNLSQKFNIDPKTAYLRNLEFGINIHTSIKAQSLINNIVALNKNPFIDFKVNGLKIGKAVAKQQYAIKIYDKGKQEDLPVQNLVRFEIAVKKMQYLKPFAIETLNDLLNINKVQPLGSILVDYWSSAIYYDKQVKWKGLTEFERKKLLYYATPRNWADFTRKQRLRAKQHFNKIITRFGVTSTQSETGILIAKKWNELTAVKCPRFNPVPSQNNSIDLSTFYPLECTDKTYPDDNLKITPINTTKKKSFPTHKLNAGDSKFCRTCKTNISTKKSNALYCSKKCNNSYQAKQRKKKRYYLKIAETVRLNLVLEKLHQSHIFMLVEYRDNNISEAFNFYQNEITAPYSWTRKVIKITIKQTGETFTSYRAKKLIKTISTLNT